MKPTVLALTPQMTKQPSVQSSWVRGDHKQTTDEENVSAADRNSKEPSLCSVVNVDMTTHPLLPACWVSRHVSCHHPASSWFGPSGRPHHQTKRTIHSVGAESDLWIRSQSHSWCLRDWTVTLLLGQKLLLIKILTSTILWKNLQPLCDYILA